LKPVPRRSIHRPAIPEISMATWLIPALKAILPHVGTVITAAKPVFTKRGEGSDANTLQQQITELQAAASSNAENTKELAAQLQVTVQALEHTAVLAQAKLRRVMLLSVAALVLSVIALGLVLFNVVAR
jgi:hypothetical protein